MFLLFPFAVQRRLRSFPWVTLALVAINFAVFLATRLDVDSWAARLGFFADPRGLFTWFSSMFVHESSVTLALNLYFLWLFGTFLEDAIGRARFLGVYVAGGLAAALLQATMSASLAPGAVALPVVGASGAIAALVGLFLVGFRGMRMQFWYFWFLLLRWKAGFTSRSSTWGIAFWVAAEIGVAVWNRVAGLPVEAALWAHLGGLAFGMAAGLLLGIVHEAMTTILSEEAAVYASVGLGPVAASRYETLQRRDPDNPDHCAAYARALAKAERPDTAGTAAAITRATTLLAAGPRRGEAVLLYEELRDKLGPRDIDPRTLLKLAEIAEAAGGYPAALDIYRDLVTGFPETREAEKARFRLPHVYLALGDSGTAHAAWREFVEAHPSSSWIPYADTVLLMGSN